MFYLSRTSSRATASKARSGAASGAKPRASTGESPTRRVDDEASAPFSLVPPTRELQVPRARNKARWSIHDRTHLQCSLVYRTRSLRDRFKIFERFEWEVYFF